MIKKSQISGFTLIELLVVISIIAILAGFGTARYLTAEKQVRDTQRKSDLNQYRIALENYASANNGVYPPLNPSICAEEDLCGTLGNGPLVPYIGTCPTDPRKPPSSCNQGGYRNYDYYPSSSGSGDKYVLYVWGGLEAQAGKTWVVCWNGKVGLTTNDWTSVIALCPI